MIFNNIIVFVLVIGVPVVVIVLMLLARVVARDVINMEIDDKLKGD